MNTDSSHEDHPGSGDGESNLDKKMDMEEQSHEYDGTYTMLVDPKDQSLDSPKESNANESKEERWKRLQNHYNDQYLKLFNEHSANTAHTQFTNLDPTQVGAVTWSTLEKEKFFYALSRKSKTDVLDIASDIGSKSELEVYEYLRLLEDEDRSRNLYARKVYNVAYADIPAAVELSGECETRLEQAADALAAYQDRFDRAVGEKMHPDHWLVDLVQARAYDKSFNDAEDDTSSNDDPVDTSLIPADGLFRLSSWLLLTERVFMNSDPSRGFNSWATQATPDEVPAITQRAISDLHQLALFHLRKVIQTAIFCAESRIRCTKGRGYDTKALVKEQDVATAIHLLGLPEDRSQFWLKLARRNQLKVVNKKDEEDESVLNYDEVERVLSQTPLGRRRRGSKSSASGSMSQTEESDYVRDHSTADVSDESESLTPNNPGEQEIIKQDHKSRYASEHGNAELPAETSNSDNDTELDTFSEDEELGTKSEDNEDRQAEISDQIASRRHEIQLYHELGWTMPEDDHSEHFDESEAKEGTPRSGRRKARTELFDWRDSISSYVESWEEHRGSIDRPFFGDNQRETKRRKTEEGIGKQHNLPLRSSG